MGVEEPHFVLKSLREQVYEYLKRQMNAGRLRQGAFLNLNEISAEMGMSKTPLRDALFQLEAEGFVTIFPRRGVMVNVLSLVKIRNIYQILGALESSVIIQVAVKVRPEDVDRMEALNEQMRQDVERGDFDSYYDKNLLFHDVYLNLTDNADLLHMVRIYKERLYDFPRNKGFLQDWEVASVEEHREMIRLFRLGDFDGVADYDRDVHWSFAVQERFIRRYYFNQSVEAERVEAGEKI
jgi:DNA-binding GntR family transcriptional regulator